MSIKKADKLPKRPPANTVESRENQLITLAVNLAEKQLAEGTASSQVVTHYLKLGSTKDRLEKEILGEQKKLLVAKTEAIKSAQRSEELFSEAIEAMKTYGGNSG